MELLTTNDVRWKKSFDGKRAICYIDGIDDEKAEAMSGSVWQHPGDWRFYSSVESPDNDTIPMQFNEPNAAFIQVEVGAVNAYNRMIGTDVIHTLIEKFNQEKEDAICETEEREAEEDAETGTGVS